MAGRSKPEAELPFGGTPCGKAGNRPATPNVPQPPGIVGAPYVPPMPGGRAYPPDCVGSADGTADGACPEDDIVVGGFEPDISSPDPKGAKPEFMYNVVIESRVRTAERVENSLSTRNAQWKVIFLWRAIPRGSF